MHEVTAASAILRSVSDKMSAAGQPMEAESVNVLVGEFRNIDAESLSFAFDSIKSEFAGCSNCSLQITPVALLAVCAGQSHQYHPEPATAFSCPKCGAGIAEVLAGRELDIVSISVAAKGSC